MNKLVQDKIKLFFQNILQHNIEIFYTKTSVFSTEAAKAIRVYFSAGFSLLMLLCLSNTYCLPKFPLQGIVHEEIFKRKAMKNIQE